MNVDWRKVVNYLQKVGSESEKTSEGSTRHGESLVGTGSDDGAWGGRSGSRGGGGWENNWGGGTSGGGGSGVGVDWGGGWDNNGAGGWDSTTKCQLAIQETVFGNSKGYQVEQYTEVATETGALTVQGQLVTVMVED